MPKNDCDDSYIDEYEESFYADIEARMKRQKEMDDEIQNYYDSSSNASSDSMRIYPS